MGRIPLDHFRDTEKLAKALNKPDIYEWLVTTGYFPESYVLPPCFQVIDHPAYGKRYFSHSMRNFKPKLAEYHQVSFPKTELIDRTFALIDPELHLDIAYAITKNWNKIIDCIFHKNNKVCSYSFPIPLNSATPGKIGGLRSGRMIYEYIEMAENDIAKIAYNYKYLIKTDITNFYPSIYTHSISWAIHGKATIRKLSNRYNYSYIGNRLDKLFQNSNDGCTIGIPIGPAVSDLIAEVILAGVDRQLSKLIDDDAVVVRFKDDYRILVKSESKGKDLIKSLQANLKEFKLDLNNEKTKYYELPDGLFRNWVSQYHAANPRPKAYYSFRRFKEVYLSVINIDRQNPSTGVIDRFLADIVTKEYLLRFNLNSRTLPKIISLLLMLADLRIKAFPKVLAIIESILKSPFGKAHSDNIVRYLDNLLQTLSEHELNNRYLISWICYFFKANKLDKKMAHKYKFKDPIIRSIYTSRSAIFKDSIDFKLFLGAKSVAKKVNLLAHLDAFKPQ